MCVCDIYVQCIVVALLKSLSKIFGSSFVWVSWRQLPPNGHPEQNEAITCGVSKLHRWSLSLQGFLAGEVLSLALWSHMCRTAFARSLHGLQESTGGSGGVIGWFKEGSAIERSWRARDYSSKKTVGRSSHAVSNSLLPCFDVFPGTSSASHPAPQALPVPTPRPEPPESKGPKAEKAEKTEKAEKVEKAGSMSRVVVHVLGLVFVV